MALIRRKRYDTTSGRRRSDEADTSSAVSDGASTDTDSGDRRDESDDSILLELRDLLVGEPESISEHRAVVLPFGRRGGDIGIG